MVLSGIEPPLPNILLDYIAESMQRTADIVNAFREVAVELLPLLFSLALPVKNIDPLLHILILTLFSPDLFRRNPNAKL